MKVATVSSLLLQQADSYRDHGDASISRISAAVQLLILTSSMDEKKKRIHKEFLKNHIITKIYTGIQCELVYRPALRPAYGLCDTLARNTGLDRFTQNIFALCIK